MGRKEKLIEPLQAEFEDIVKTVAQVAYPLKKAKDKLTELREQKSHRSGDNAEV